ncbi:MAG TPA: hypothetical protein PKN27_07495 [Propionibacteriaceae bacterium]|nr:hypothetical protein [Propionibacteriaceae bacterium]
MPDVQPLLLFVPPELAPDAREGWVEAILAELRAKSLVPDAAADAWRTMLVETASVGLHPIAVAQLLLLVPDAQPVYVWASVGEAPSGRAASLVRAIGEEIAQGFTPQFSQIDIDGVPVEVGMFLGRDHAAEKVDVVFMMGGVSTTLTLSELGDMDVCLWFTSTEIDQLPGALPFLAHFIRDPDLAAFLTT